MNLAVATESSSTTAASPPGFTGWPAIVAVFLLSVVATYWPTLTGMAHVWETSDTYAHGWLIAPISLYLLYQQRAALAATPQALCWWALLPIVAAGAGWALAALADIQVVQQLAVVTIAIGVVLFLMGWRWANAAMFPLGFLYLAVPLGDGLVPHMIDFTADFVVGALRLSGIPVYRDGTFFVIPSGSWSVVSGCSGMRYLMATVTVGVLFAQLNYRSVWRKLIFVVVAIVFAFVANWLRAYGIVMIAHLSDMKLALGVDHYIYGWVFFGIIIFVLMMIGGRFSDRGAETPQATVPPAPRVRPAALLPALCVLAIVVHAWPLATRALVAAAPRAQPDETMLASAFAATPVAAPVSDLTPHYTGTPVLMTGGVADAARPTGWHVAWYPTQRQGEELIHAGNRLVSEKHDPWRQQSKRERATGTPAVPTVIESVLRSRSGTQSLIVWQWYWVGGEVTVNPLAAKFAGVASQLRGDGNPGASVLVYTLIDEDTEQDAARDLLASTLARVAPSAHAVFDQTMAR